MPLRFKDGVSADDRRMLERHVDDVLEIQQRGGAQSKEKADKYELTSRSHAIHSRNVMQDLKESESMALRLYGVIGVGINQQTRGAGQITPRQGSEHPPLEVTMDRFSRQTGITSPSQISDGRILRDNQGVVDFLTDGRNVVELVSGIDKVIADKTEMFQSHGLAGDCLYRISGVHKGVLDEAIPGHPSAPNTISPGDIIVDRALWSTTVSSSAAVYRYSGEGGHASGAAIARNHPIEEVLYVIDRTPDLQAIDISGFKAVRRGEGPHGGQDQFSSGEMLVRSETPFRVMAIEDTLPGSPRRAVVLRPVNADELDLTREIVRNSFDGALKREVGGARRLPMAESLPTPMSRSPSPPPTASANAALGSEAIGAAVNPETVGRSIASMSPGHNEEVVAARRAGKRRRLSSNESLEELPL